MRKQFLLLLTSFTLCFGASYAQDPEPAGQPGTASEEPAAATAGEEDGESAQADEGGTAPATDGETPTANDRPANPENQETVNDPAANPDGVTEEPQSKPELLPSLTDEERQSLPAANYQNPRKYIVNDINVHGVEHLNVDNILMVSGIKKGDEVYIPGNYISQAIQNFWNRRYFSDVDIVGNIQGDSINFDIYFKERPLVYTWRFEGIRKGQANELKDNLGLKSGLDLSDFTINKNINLIREHFIEKGFRNVEVDPIIENDTTFRNAVTVTFKVTKNNKVKIGEIDFTGNEVFSDKKLRSQMKKTGKKNLNLFKNSKLKEEEYANDLENIIDFYNSRGYRNANIVSDSIYDINHKRIGIKIDLEEGNKYYFRNVTWVGNSRHSTEMLEQLLAIQPGDTYDKKNLHKRLGIGKENNPEDPYTISSLYQNDGYLFFQIDPTETIIGADSIDLELKIYEGKQATINEVGITGNLRVDDEVIRREINTRPGDLYNRSLLMQTMRLLSQMQHFNPEAIMPDIQPVTGELVNISWNLEEQASDQAEISGGWGSGMFVGSVGLTLNNVSLKNFFKKGAWRPYPQGQSQQLRIRFQTNGSYYTSTQLSFTEPWLGGKKPNALTVSTHFSHETDASYYYRNATRHFRTVGVAVGIGRRLNWPDPYFTLYNEISYSSYMLDNWYDYFVISNGNANTFAFTTAFGRSSVDQPIYPRRGSEFSVSVTATPPYSLFDNKKYDDPNLPDEDRYRWIEYHKWKLKGEWYTPLSSNGNLVLMARAEMGYLGYYNRNKKSPFEGFDVGGDGMSGYNIYGVDVISLRGYEDGALTPYRLNSDYAHVYNKYTVELRYPFILKPSSTIYGLIFAEGGNGFTGWNKFNPFELKRSLGVGVRLYLPIVGMLGIDWGYGFDKPNDTANPTKRSGGQIHYVIGMQF
ncbi:MAG: outer membrane protein assembly factor BamA [Rikenellaceae bacterium]|nr:outer membrane protein assembly factor BamA [Rikenellaceae bacterium]